MHFEDSSGFEYSYRICRSGFNILAVASRAGVVQMGYERAHTISGLNLRHQEKFGLSAAETAVSLLDAGAVRGGMMNAVLNPELAGVFAHEAVGHASEGDAIQRELRPCRYDRGTDRREPTIVDDTPDCPSSGSNRWMPRA